MRYGVTALTLSLVLVSGCGNSHHFTATAPGNYGTGKVIRVVDGDTIHVSVGGKDVDVRWLEMNSPEVHHPGLPVQCGGPEAEAWVKQELPAGTTVRLVADPKLDQVDKYGRTLAYVYLRGVDLNLREVKLGYAKVYHFQGHRGVHATAFDRAQQSAQAANRGIWGPPCNGNTDQPEPKG